MRVDIATTYEEANVYISRLLAKGINTFGFDTETTVDRLEDKGKVSVIQIYGADVCCIFQVYRIWKNEGMFPKKLAKFLNNATYIKVGVAADNDARYITQSYGVSCRGVLDIQYLCISLGIKELSMDKLAQKYLNTRKYEKNNVFTNWDIDLDVKHMQYGAIDGYLSLAIYYAILHIPLTQDLALEYHPFDIEHLVHWIKSTQQGKPTKEALIKRICNHYPPAHSLLTSKERYDVVSCVLDEIIEMKHITYE